MWVLICHRSMQKPKKYEFKTFEEMRSFVSDHWNEIIIDKILKEDGSEWE